MKVCGLRRRDFGQMNLEAFVLLLNRASDIGEACWSPDLTADRLDRDCLLSKSDFPTATRKIIQSRGLTKPWALPHRTSPRCNPHTSVSDINPYS